MVAVRYKCRCMAAEAAIEVRERTDDEDVVAWVEGVVGAALAVDHRRRSPLCMATKTDYVKVPAPENAPFLGGKPRLDS